MTVRQALDSLERRGLLVRVWGRGTFAAGPSRRLDAARHGSLTQKSRRLGRQTATNVLPVSEEAAGKHSAAALALTARDRVHRIIRIRHLDGLPHSVEHWLLPANFFPGIGDMALDGSMEEVLRHRYGEHLSSVIERFSAVVVSSPETEILGTEPGTPLGFVEQTLYNLTGAPIAHVHEFFQGDRTRVLAVSDILPASLS